MKTYTHFRLTCQECYEVWTINTHDVEMTETEAAQQYGACDNCESTNVVAVGIEKNHKKH